MNRIVKIKGHAQSALLPDLECYHSLGNAVADRAADEVCRQLLPALTDKWHTTTLNRESEAAQLYEFYKLSLDLQKHRKDFVSSVPASLNPQEPHPQYQAGAMAAFLASWTVQDPLSFSLEFAQQQAFFSHGYWGSSLLTCVLTWPHPLRWAPTADSIPQAAIRVSWMELVLSFMIFSKGFIPVHRRNPKGESSFAWAHSRAEATAFSYTWNESAAQFAHIVQQIISLSGCTAIPGYVQCAQVCSLYRQGAGTCVFGWSHRPCFPAQADVCRIVEATFR